jgi:glycosyltransferase involved in cell wall biosynthesis
MTTTPLHERLTAFVVEKLEALERTHLPGYRIPRIFAGHEVGADVRADLAFTLGLLGGRDDALEIVLRDVDGRRTNTFFSYRIAETLLRHPHLLGRFDEATIAQLHEACDSTSFLPAMADGRLPRNYAAVLLRCEAGRERLGLGVDQTVLADLTARTRGMLDANPGGYLDDSHTGIARYDIYSGDIYLFTEPVADRLGDVWTRGARAALDLVERVETTNGAAFAWGRSSGALAACLTVELGGLAASHHLVDDVDPWLARADHAFATAIPSWFADDGLITAHQHRSTFGYRGPFRRLQMTLDCLGKLADTALVLRDAGIEHAPAVDVDALFRPRDELITFDARQRAGVWTYRSRDLAFVLPVVGSTVSDYLPAPHNPGLFEVPVDADLPTGVPFAFRKGIRYTAGHLPTTISKTEGGLRLDYDGFPRSHQFEIPADAETVPGTRSVTYRVEGRTLHVDEELRFTDDALPHALAIQIAETKDRPLRIDFRGEGTATVVDVEGLKEYRSFWSELPRVHQLDLPLSTRVAFGWSATPKLRLLTTGLTHHYHRSIYDPLAADVVERQVSTGRLLAADAEYLAAWDVFHLHWPEWFLGPDLGRHRTAIDALQASGIRIVWTQHNLVPHDKDPRQHDIYAAWAAAADGVIHHSEYGQRRVRDRYPFRDDAVHRVIPHVHFGHLSGEAPRPDDGVLRLGIVGAPRAEKDVQLVLDAFARVRRPDVELHVFSLGPGDVVPDDPRITAVPYEMVDRLLYDERLRALDALVLPFAEADMITTGTVGDVIGAGVPALVSDWGYLRETLGAAGIPYGDDLAGAIEALDRAALEQAATAARGLRDACSADAVAAQHLALLEAVGTTRL